MGGGGGGGGGAGLMLWPNGWAPIRGWVLIRAWAVIRGNAICFRLVTNGRRWKDLEVIEVELATLWFFMYH